MKLQVLLPRGVNPNYAFVRLHLTPEEKAAVKKLNLDNYCLLEPSKYGLVQYKTGGPILKPTLAFLGTAALGMALNVATGYGVFTLLGFLLAFAVYWLVRNATRPLPDYVFLSFLVDGMRIEQADYESLQARLADLVKALSNIGRQMAESYGYEYHLDTVVERVPAEQLKAA